MVSWLVGWFIRQVSVFVGTDYVGPLTYMVSYKDITAMNT